MKMHQPALALVAFVCCAATGQSAATAGSPQLVQAFVGFNQPNDYGLPCVNCLSYTDGTVFVQPNNFVSSGSAGLYYVVLQANGWAGEIDASFKLVGGRNVIQRMTFSGTITAGQTTIVLSRSATIPQTTYSGRAVLEVTTTATPSDGSPQFFLKSSAIMEIGKTGTHRLVQVFAGLSYSSAGQGFRPCAYPDCGPPGTIGVLPAQFPEPSSPPAYYVAFQADGWIGTVNMTYDLIERGKLVQSYSQAGGIAQAHSHGHLVAVFGYGGSLSGPHVGPAIVRVITKAGSHHGATKAFTLQSSSPIEIQSPN